MTTLLTPAYKLTLGKHVADTTTEPKASATTDLVVTLDMDSLPDTAGVVLGQVGGIDAALEDEAGRKVQSEKLLDVVIANGKVVRAGNQFGVGGRK